MPIISDRKSLQWFEVSFRSGLILHSTYRKKELERPNSFYVLLQNYENTYLSVNICTNSPINLEECTYLFSILTVWKMSKNVFFVFKGVSEPFYIFLMQFLYGNLKNFDTHKIFIWCPYLQRQPEKDLNERGRVMTIKYIVFEIKTVLYIVYQ